MQDESTDPPQATNHATHKHCAVTHWLTHTTAEPPCFIWLRIYDCFTYLWLEIGGGGRGRILQWVYDYLLSVPPTSVESERAFSAAGVVCSKLRTRLGDETLDNLCMLRTFFQH